MPKLRPLRCSTSYQSPIWFFPIFLCSSCCRKNHRHQWIISKNRLKRCNETLEPSHPMFEVFWSLKCNHFFFMIAYYWQGFQPVPRMIPLFSHLLAPDSPLQPPFRIMYTFIKSKSQSRIISPNESKRFVNNFCFYMT